jgi:hypothetical protein
VDFQLEAAGHTALLRGVADHARMILIDKRGPGMSDRVAGVVTLAKRSDDVQAVMDAAWSERAACGAGGTGSGGTRTGRCRSAVKVR